MKTVEAASKRKDGWRRRPLPVLLAAGILSSLGSIPEATAGPTDLANLSVAITHTPEPAPGGSDLTFTMAVKNTGPATATGIQLVTVLYYANGSSTNYWRGYDALSNGGDCSPAVTDPMTVRTPVVCELDPIVANGTVNVTITMNVNTELQGAIVLGATVTATESDIDPGNNADTDVAHVNQSGPLIDGL